MPEEQIKKLDFFSMLELENLPDADKMEILTAFKESLIERILMKSANTLTEKQKNDLLNFSEKNGSDEMLEFMKNMLPNYDELFKEEALKLKEEIILEYNKNK